MKDILFKELSNGLKMPLVGLGTFKSTDEKEMSHIIKTALEAGYRHLDTAEIYNNEHLIGDALSELNIDRKEVFITSKVFNNAKTYEEAKKAILGTLKNLKTDYIDLYLVHWPKDYDRNYEVYKALEDYYKKGVLKAIGVSNFQIHHLDNLISRCEIKPMMNQVELHPGLQQWPLVEYCNKLNIDVTSYGPLMKGQAFDIPVLKEIANKYDKTVVNIIVRWGIQRNIFMIPKSSTPSRIVENFEVFDFELTNEDMQAIRNLNTARRLYSDPDNTDF